jgi:AcrR family transcriptional regulator
MLDALERLLRRAPLTTLTTNRIAEVAGVSVGSLYQYFPDKHSLAGALIERKAARDLEALTATLLEKAPSGLEATMRETVYAMVELHRADAALMRALLGLVAQTGKTEAVRALAARGREGLQQLLEGFADDIRPGDPALMTFIGARALEEVIHAAVMEQPELLADPRFAEEVFQLAWRYVRRAE